MMADSQVYEFPSIFSSGKSRQVSGKIRFAAGGIGFKEESSGKVSTVPRNEIKKITWQKVSRDHGLRLQLQNGRVVRFDGFAEDALDEIKMCIGRLYDLDVDSRELSSRGWNWGQTEFQGENLVFSVASKTAFEIPMSEVVNSSMPSKNEVTLEVKNAGPENDRDDQLVEMRFFFPNKTEDEDGQPQQNATDELNQASYFFETVKTMADIGVVTGDSIVPFQELPFLVPRGRYEVDMFSDFMRMHGKSYDYKILYKSIKNLFLLPKPDDIHVLFVIALDPPIRQGQTRYPFLVMQFLADEDLEISLNMEQSELDEKYGIGKLKQSYEQPTSEVVSKIFTAMTKIPLVDSSTFKSAHGSKAIKCSYKANEGHIYPLDESLLFLPKPATLMPHSSISSVTFSRVNQGGSSTFDMKVQMKRGGEFSFGGLYKDEHTLLDEYFKMHGIKLITEKSEDDIAFNALASSSSDDEMDGPMVKKAKADVEEGDEDEDSEEDGDFVADNDSDVAEEFDENYDSSGADEEEE